MERPTTCPQCASRFEDIHGLIYALGMAVGKPCEHEWHRGPGYDPSELHLTDEDRAFLMRQRIRWW